MLLITLLAIPLFGAVFSVLIKGISINKYINIPLISSLTLLAASFSLKSAFQGEKITYIIPLSSPFTPTFSVDALSAIFIILSAFLWVAVSIYMPKYMEHEGKAWGFQLCTLLTLFAVIGIFSAGDLLTMLLFFELMTVSSYFWVIHRWDKEATKAGYFYLFFSIVGGLLITLGIVLMGGATSALPDIGSGVAAVINPKLFSVSIAVFVAGFGIKAGMVPLHIWLPHAHSVAPTPGSALLSGLLIKIGAYGLIRVGEFAGFGTSLMPYMSWLGSALIGLGTLTMLVGVLSALLQSNAKKLLAYHSVSQMGYIILGLGCGLYLAEAGGLAFLGALYHIINHALFKAALFLGVGLVYLATKETDLGKLGGLLKKFPWTATFMLIAALGIAGMPGFNGYASKTLLHHGLLQAVAKGPGWLGWVERLFNLVGIGTAASFAKLYFLIFLKKPAKSQLPREKFSPATLTLALFSLLIIAIGSNPRFLPQVVLQPAAKALGLNAAADLAAVNFWQLGDLLSMALTLALGLAFCWAGLRWGFFAWSPQAWLDKACLAGRAVGRAWRRLARRGRAALDLLVSSSRRRTQKLLQAVRGLDQARHGSVGRISLVGISADAAIVILTLILLVAWYILTDFNLG